MRKAVREHDLHAVRDNLLEPVVDEREHGGHQQRHEHVAAVVVEQHRNAKHLGRAGGGAQRGALDAGGHALPLFGVHQVGELRGHQSSHNGATEPRVDLELLRGVVGNHDRQEVEHALPDGLDEHQAGVGFLARHDTDGDAQVDQGDDDRRAEQHAQDRAERVGQVLEERVHPRDFAAHLGALGGFDVGIGLRLVAGDRALASADARHLGQVHDVLVHCGDRAADDDLVTVAGLRHRSQHALHGLQPVLVYFARVDEFETQASRAVRQALDVARATDRFDDLRCS